MVLVYIDFPRRKPLPPREQAANKALAAYYGVKVFPTGFILDRNGSPLGSIVGTTSLENYIAKLEEILKKASAK